MKMSNRAALQIRHSEQPYYDKPVFLEPKFTPPTLVEQVAHKQVFGEYSDIRVPKPIHAGFRRVFLKWVKP